MENKKLHWLIQYNPLYLISAVFLLWGMYMLNLALLSSSMDMALIDIILAAINEGYQFTLLGALVFLVRVIKDLKSSIFLGGLAALLLLDPTYVVETFTANGWLGYLSTLGWLGLFFVKAAWLRRILKLQVSTAFSYMLTTGVLFYSIIPHFLVEGVMSESWYRTLFFMSFHLLILYILKYKPSLTMQGISPKTLQWAGIGLFLFLYARHGVAQIITFEIAFGGNDILLLLLLPIHFVKDWRFQGALLTTVACIGISHGSDSIGYILSLLSLVKAFQSRDIKLTLFSMVLAWLSLRLHIAPDLANLLLLFAMGIHYWKLKYKENFIVMVLIGLNYGYKMISHFDPAISKSIIVIFVGFAMLITALAIHWYAVKRD